MSERNPLEPIRKAITELDSELLTLLARRRALSLDVARSKEDAIKPVRDSERESALLTRLVSQGRELGLDGQYISRLFHTIIEDSVLRQQAWFQAQNNPQQAPTTRVAYLGAKGSYSYLAAHHYFGRRDRTLVEMGMESFDAIFQAVEQGQADHGILPLENTSSGSINEVFDLLQHTNLHIVGETTETIAHCLLVQPGTELEQIRTIYAHPQVHTQCSRFLASLSGIHQAYCASSAEAMEKAAADPSGSSAAIGSERGGALYGLTVRDTALANQQRNESRFIVVARKPVTVPPQVPAKTTLIMATGQKPGALVEALLVLRDQGINMTKLESRPIHGNPWEEMFYLDVEANVQSEAMRNALSELTRLTRFIKVLGCYPCETILPTELDSTALANDPRLTEDATLATSAPAVSDGSAALYSREHKFDDTLVRVGKVTLGGDAFVTIAGPAAVESEQQIQTTAHAVREHGGAILSGGCFLDSVGGGFAGLGQAGVDALCLAGQRHGLPVMTEVTQVEQVSAVAAQVDLLQIGEHNMHNTALLSEVGRSQRPVILKRGLMATLEELLAAAEIIMAQGNQQVILCERGIRTFDSASRHTLDLSAVPLLRGMTHLPILIDPSQAAGRRDLILPLAKAAKAVGAHGLLIEVHPSPEQALREQNQQLYVEQYAQLMKSLYC
ncbi:bifunctional 3-deoxy-7-phosphoheptulonate synthase/chorismate mutase [Ferrimonas balearica]|uniref:bifunctional 3-deoxy-7-phosphoheptulonate synthase/chorismate mutase n=1 Tax=Ferrimonas balearica TaxID=44012 RepID=UPI001C55A41D|nr:bifunctional 3-deoxy-7-phosphoheptulonate synthase/chorismate mutase [Ferrimonas balearica]MBW3140767.1 bifunctional 3-deoxy-7-phosphoheptulonate synthase/chorismate mutase [Ferrimonas balearica]MBY5981533.1 bifunctional 3-deoxy-7-phosphoheptulonate synthase/chorismate mutase [Ferrimonas balearica]MBY6107429.1 bifunctional 3-deoxy-7-phosphoheptulonate synthase/chorismate mutase [Ferrimonas balearica]